MEEKRDLSAFLRASCTQYCHNAGYYALESIENCSRETLNNIAQQLDGAAVYQEKGNVALNWIAVACITFAASLPIVSRTLNRHPYRLFAVEFLALQTNWVVWDLELYSLAVARAFYASSGLSTRSPSPSTELTIFKVLLTSFEF